MRCGLAMFLVVVCAGAVWSPVVQAQSSSPAAGIGLYAYPRNKQDATQQQKDENECYGAARQNTGVDPTAPPPVAPSAESQQAAQKAAAEQAGKSTPKGGAIKGSAKGAAGGAAGTDGSIPLTNYRF